MTIKEAIAKAVEGGWKDACFENGGVNMMFIEGDEFLLMPSFWKSLGKTMGWYEDKELIPRSWLDYWVKLILHLAQEKSIEDFFNTL